MALFEDDPDLIRRQERQVREQAERARVMRQQIEAVQGVGNSPDNSVEVVVDSGGTLLGIGIEGVSNEVCEAIMSAYAPRQPSARTTRALSACARCMGCPTRKSRRTKHRTRGLTHGGPECRIPSHLIPRP